MTRVYYREAVGALVVFDVTRASTFDAVLKWKDDLDSKVSTLRPLFLTCHSVPFRCKKSHYTCTKPATTTQQQFMPKIQAVLLFWLKNNKCLIKSNLNSQLLYGHHPHFSLNSLNFQCSISLSTACCIYLGFMYFRNKFKVRLC